MIGDRPALAMPAMNDERWFTLRFPAVEHPIFADRRHAPVEFDIAFEVFVGIAGQDLGNQDWRNVLPNHVFDIEVDREIPIGRDVRLGHSQLWTARNKDARLARYVVDNVGAYARV